MENPEEIREEFNLNTMWKLLKLNKRFIGLFTAIFLVFIFILTFLMPHEYESISSALPPEKPDGMAGFSSFIQNLSGGLSVPGIASGYQIELYADILKSHSVAKYIADKCNLRAKPQFGGMDDYALYDYVSRLIDVEVNRTGLIVVSVKLKTTWFPNSTDKDHAAALSAEIANAAFEGLNYVNRMTSVSKAKKKRIFIERMLVNKKVELDSVDKELQKFQEENKILAIDEQTKAILTNAVNVGTELSVAEIELGVVLQDYEPSSPIVKAYQQRVNRIKDQYRRIQRGGLVTGDEFSIPLAQVPILVRKYTNLVRDQKIMEQVVVYLESQRYQEAIQEESDVSTIETLDKAIPPRERSSPSRKIMLILGFILSIVISGLFVTARAFYKGRLYLKKESII